MVTLYKWSVENYHRIIATGILSNERVELLEGEIVQMSPEGPLHTSTNYYVVQYLRKLLGQQAVVREAHPITLSNSEPQPDIAIVRSPYTNYLTCHPSSDDIYWLIEISNHTLNEDLSRKKIIYAGNNIREYWVIDLPNKKLWIFTNPQNNDYLKVREVNTGIINPLAFPKIRVEIEELIIT